jgi:L-iditol 2-dehydrogenase
LLVRVLRIGVCGSDIHVYHGKHPFTTYPVVQGHEFSGTVEAIGGGVSGFAPGDRIVVMPQVTCGQCYPCRHGMYHICDRLRVMGFQTGGAAQEYFPVPASMALKLPDSIGLEEAAMIEPLAVAAHALSRYGDVRGKNVVVLGAGTIGNMMAQAARALGAARILITDVSDYRLEMARKVGFDLVVNVARQNLEEAWKALGPDGADVILECAGSAPAISDAVRLARKGSMIVVVGVFGAPPVVDLSVVQDRELTLAGSLMYRKNDYEAAISMASRGAIRFQELISRRFSLDDYAAAYRTIDEAAGNIMKVIICLE